MLRYSLSVSLITLSTAVAAQDAPSGAPREGVEYSPYPAQDFPNRVLFGDTHLHTSFSADAGLVGAILSPDDAFRYAKGENVTSNTGIPARISRPLDWLVVTDHAENLGLPAALAERDATLIETEWGAELADIAAPGTLEAQIAAYEKWITTLGTGNDPLAETPFGQIMWERATEASERHNQPGLFTAMIGYEWTSGPNGNNLHRNVIYRDDKDKADQKIPFCAYDSEDPERL